MPEMDRYVVPWLPGDQPGRDDEAYYMVAALFAAWHQGRGMLETFEGNLGRSLRSIADRVPGHAAGLERRVTGVERRVIGLLAAHREELPTHLRHAISLLRTHSVPVDWIRLLADLPRWDHPDRIVQRRWARDFWRIDATSEPEGAIPSDLEAGNR
jgi:CRISPR system Cascade subunit CasB